MARKKSKPVEQLSLFENPKGPTTQQFREELMREFRASKGEYIKEAAKKRKRNRGDSIFLPEDGRAYQDSFAVQPVYEYPEWCFPPVSTKPESVEAILNEAILCAAAGSGPVRVGLDFEFSPEKHKISIIGVANTREAAACRWEPDFLRLLYRCVDMGVVFVGHWVLGADKFELENAAREAGLPELLARPNGYLTPRGAWLDSMGLHYLCNQALCLCANTDVMLPHGRTATICDVVNHPEKYPTILATDENGTVLESKITGRFKNKRNGRKLYRLVTEYGNKGFIDLTGDHKVLTNFGYVSVDAIVAQPETDWFIHTGKVSPSTVQKQILAGMSLGDIHWNNYSQIEVMHCLKQEGYLDLKTEALSSYCTFGSKYRRERNPNNITLRQRGFATPYNNWIKANLDNFIESNFTELAFAVWFMDDGWLHDNCMWQIATTSRTDSENEKLAKMCRNLFSLSEEDCWFVRTPGGNGTIRFSAKCTRILSARLAKYFLPCLRRKLKGDNLSEFDKSLFFSEERLFFWDKPIISELKSAQEHKTVYCLETEHGNFLTSGGVVSNCKAPGKEADEDGSLGYMGIGSALFLSSSIPAGYKHCRGVGCTGPCPRCRVFDYCAVDAYSGLIIAENYLSVMREKNISFSCYEKWAELTETVCLRAETRGLLVNKPFLDNFDKELEQRKAELFPHENSAYKYFNPQSGKQIIDYFADRGIPLRDSHGKASSTKPVILAALERELEKYGFRELSEFESSDDQVVLSEVDELLYKLFTYKDTGKESTAWFNQEKKFLVYHDNNWWIHPRFSTTGTSTTRLSSSRPNFQNFKKRGLGAAIRKAVIPRPGCIMCANDAKQLEFRIVSYEAGIQVPGYDFFDWLVGRANGQFEKAAELMHAKARDIAKRVNHACLTADHEVLTKDGWIKISKYTGQSIMNYYEDGSLDFSYPLRYHSYEAPAETIVLSGRGLQTECTENHAFPVRITGTWKGRKYNKLQRKTVDQFTPCGDIPVSGNYLNSFEVYSDLEIQRAIAVQADANLSRNRARFHFVKERKIERIKQLFPEIQLYKCACHQHTGVHGTVIFSSPLINSKKQFTWEFLKLSPRQRELFLTEILLWDGCIMPGHKTYSNTDLQSVTVAQTIAHLSGKQALLRTTKQKEGKKVCYALSFNRRTKASIACLQITKNTSNTKKVYCFTTSSGYFLVRHKNTISVTGNSAYGEGFKLYADWQLATDRIDQQRKDGRLRIFEDWEMDGKVVGFTGANLAQTLFGDKTDISRRKALNLQFDVWLKAVPEIHPWHRKMAKIAERGWAQLRTGHYLELLGSPSDNFKAGCAYYGQGGGAQFMQDKMLQCARLYPDFPMCAQIHDDLMWDNIPASWDIDRIKGFVAHLGNEEVGSFPGLLVPFDTQIGPNWGEMKSI